MRNMKRILAVLALMATTSAVAADVVRGKIENEDTGWVETVDKVIDVKPGGTLRLDSDRGGIEINSADRKGVRVIVKKISDAILEQEAELILQDLEVDVQRDGDDVEVTIEAASDRRARSLQVEIRVIVPTRYNVDVQTGGGGIEIDDLEGNVLAQTSGGGIDVGYIRNGSVDVRTSGGGIDIDGIENGSGKARTSGGGIDVGDVTGDLSVQTAGGGIDVGAVGGELDAQTSGGGIRIGKGGGTVNAETGGGGIQVEGSGGSITVRTSGGGIDIEDAGGPVLAKTSGGGIRLDGAAGPVDVRTSGGGINLSDIHGSIDAFTAGGGIVAELVTSDPGVDTHCTLETAGGGITIRLPADLKATVDAELRLSGARRKYEITSDFDLDIDDSSRRIVARGKLNGGGDLIRLRTTNGDIKIQKR